MKIKVNIIIASMLIFATSCCKSAQPRQEQKKEAQEVSVASEATSIKPGLSSKYIPKAHIYRTTGDYIQNVPITLNAAGDCIVSYPAPSDLRGECTPIQLADGWLMDRRGVSANSVFTRYTYREYADLPTAPSTTELMDAIIPGARVEKIVELPMTLSAAVADTVACNRIIKDGMKECQVIYSAPHIQQ